MVAAARVSSAITGGVEAKAEKITQASFAGQPSSSIGIAFLKTYAAICLEGCVIVLACVIFSDRKSTRLNSSHRP